jgi:zinc D-Ala-D-Ala carboxypeptidase
MLPILAAASEAAAVISALNHILDLVQSPIETGEEEQRAGRVAPVSPEDWRHFDLDEFACPCCGRNEISPPFVGLLDQARELVGVPFRVSSGYRCQAHNRQVGGVRDSEHLVGLAADILAVDSEARFLIVSAALQVGIRRIGIHEHFVHLGVSRLHNPDVLFLY